MKNPTFPRSRRAQPFVAILAALGVALALFSSGCTSTQEVARIVAQSNAAMLAGQVGLPEPGGDKPAEPWRAPAEQIEAFAAAHADQPAIVAPLHVREAMLLLGHGQVNRAREVFALVADKDLATDRDKALKANADTLVWWFSRSAASDWTERDHASAKRALADLARAQDSLADSPPIRDYLAEMRAWIGVTAARQSTNADLARDRLAEAVDVYARTLTAADIAALESGDEKLPDPAALSQDVRRRLRAKGVLDFARETNRTSHLAAHPANAFADRLINR